MNSRVIIRIMALVAPFFGSALGFFFGDLSGFIIGTLVGAFIGGIVAGLAREDSDIVD